MSSLHFWFAHYHGLRKPGSGHCYLFVIVMTSRFASECFFFVFFFNV